MKRIVLFILIFAMMLGTVALGGCDSEGRVEVETTAALVETLPETEPVPTSAVLFDMDAMNYTLVRGTYAGTVVVDAVKELVAAFRERSAGTWNTSIKDDFVNGQNRDDIFEIEGFEILVGVTNRKESHDVLATLNREEFVIKFVGDKLVIIGFDEYATAAAVALFIETYLPSDGINALELDLDLNIAGEASLRKIAVNSEATYRIMTWNLGCMVSADNKGEAECIDIITRYLPDIIGLQECNNEVHTKVLASLPDYYAFANKKHNNSSTVNYTPIMYNTQLFTLLKSDVEWLRGRYTGTNTKSLSWAVFEDNNGVKFALINFHGAVCSNSYKGFENYTSAQLSEQANIWKLDNVVQVLEIKQAIVSEFGDIPIMISGDNNFNSSSQQYKNLTAEGFTDAEVTARISRMTGYKTSYSYGSIPGEGLSIDHIFGINGVDFVVHGIVRGEDVWKASDHSPVFVDFNLTK